MKFRAIWSSLWMVGFAGAASAQSTFSYETPGKSLEQVMKEFSATAGHELKASPDLANEIVAIRVVNVPFDTLKGQLASLFHADWTLKGDREYLSQTSDEEAGEKRIHNAVLVAAFSKALHSQSDALQKQPAFDAEGAANYANRVSQALSHFGEPGKYAAALNTLAPQSPSSRAVTRLVASFSAQDFVDLPVRMRITYSNSPNPVQHPLPDASLSAVSQYIEEQTLWANEAAARKIAAPSRNGQAFALPQFLSEQAIPSGVPAKVLVSFYRESERGRVMVEFKVAAANGRLVALASSSVRPSFDPAPVTGASVHYLMHPVALTGTSAEMSFYSTRALANSAAKASLFHPETVDPLGIAYGSTLLRAARDENCNLLADLTDQLPEGALQVNGFHTTAEYLSRLAEKGQKSGVDQGWITVAPNDLYLEKLDRTNRTALGTYLREATGPSFSIEDQAASALALPDPLENMLAPELLARLLNQRIGLHDMALLRFYGSLSTAEQERAQSSEGLNLTQLTSDGAVQALNEMVFGRMNPLIVKGNDHSDLWKDPTECMSTGLPSSSVVHLSTHIEEAVFDLDQDKAPFKTDQGAVTPGALAFLEYERRHPDRYPGATSSSDNVNAAHFGTGQLKHYQFDFRFLPEVTSTGTLECRTLAPHDALMLSDLPGDFLAQVHKQLIQIEKDELQARGTAPATRLGVNGNP